MQFQICINFQSCSGINYMYFNFTLFRSAIKYSHDFSLVLCMSVYIKYRIPVCPVLLLIRSHTG